MNISKQHIYYFFILYIHFLYIYKINNILLTLQVDYEILLTHYAGVEL